MRHRLVALALVMTVVGCAPAPVWTPTQSEIVDAAVDVPIDLPAHGLPVVQVGRGGSSGQPSFGVIDTGAGASMLTPAFASRHGFQQRGVADLQMRDALQKTRASPRVARVAALDVAGASFREFDAVVDDLPMLASMSEQLQVVLARPLFRDVLLTIDYPQRRLRIERGALPEPDGRDVLPLRRDQSGHLLLPVKLRDEQAWLIIDTGHTGQGVLLSRYRLLGMRWASTPVEGDEVRSFLGATRSRIGRMAGDMTIGRHTIRRPIVAIAYDDEREFIGADILRHFIVTIDQKNDRIRLLRPIADSRSAADATQPIVVPPVRRFGFTIEDAGGVVKVVPGSEAQAAGLLDGDRVLAINGVPLARMTYLHHEAMEQSDRPLTVEIDRAGQRAVIHIPLTIVVP